MTRPQPTSALQPDCPHSCPCALDWAYPGPLAVTKAKHTLSRLYVLSLLVPPLPRVPCPNHSCVCVFFSILFHRGPAQMPFFQDALPESHDHLATGLPISCSWGTRQLRPCIWTVRVPTSFLVLDKKLREIKDHVLGNRGLGSWRITLYAFKGSRFCGT